VSTLNPCCEKYSLIEKQIDSSSSTTSSFRGASSARRVFALWSRPRKSSLRRPDTVFSFSIEVGLSSATLLSTSVGNVGESETVESVRRRSLNKTVFDNPYCHARVAVVFLLIAYDGAVDGG